MARLVTTLVAGLAGILTVGVLPAAADTVGIGQYVALGDSFAAGQGASAPEDYLNNCLQSPNGYPALLDAENQIHLRANAACTGATTSDAADEQLSALKQSTRLVTLTVGAADLGLSQVLAACTAGTPTQCQEAIRLANLLCLLNAETKASSGGVLQTCTRKWQLRRPMHSSWPLAIRSCLSLSKAIRPSPQGPNQRRHNPLELRHREGCRGFPGRWRQHWVYVDVTETFAGHA